MARIVQPRAEAKALSNKQKLMIMEAWDYCDTEDKSTEFMLQYMSDVSGADYDTVVDYIVSRQSSIDRKEYYASRIL